MTLEDLLIQTAPNFVASFAGAALFWRIQCPNKRCCQMKAVHTALERTPELK